MLAQTARRTPIGFDMDRVAKSQETCHDGFLGTTDALRVFCPQTFVFGLDQGLQSLTKSPLPG
jgi:hypothetical protein